MGITATLNEHDIMQNQPKIKKMSQIVKMSSKGGQLGGQKKIEKDRQGERREEC